MRPTQILMAATTLSLAFSADLSAQRGRGGQDPPPTAQAAAPIDLTGYWVSIVNEDWRWRMVTPPPGDFASMPLNEEGQRVGELWTPEQDGSCLAYGMANLMRMPTRLHVTWRDAQTLQIETDAGQQTRLLHFGDAAEPRAPSLQGHSVAEWRQPGRLGRGANAVQPPGGTLSVSTDSMSGGWLRRNGAPYSDQATVQEYFDTFDSLNDEEWLVVTTIVSDSLYLNTDFVTSSHFKREATADAPPPANWNPTPCRP